MCRSLLITGLLLFTFATGGAAAAERPSLGLGGGGLEIGLAAPEHADRTLQYGGVVHLGSFWKPWLHLSAGASYWSTDIDRGALGSDVEGTISDLAIRTDLRWEAGRLFGFYPYLVTGLAAHSISADLPDDRSTESALSGLNWGVDAGVGVTSAARGLRYGVEWRRRFVDDVAGWTLTAGVGWFFPRSRQVREYRVETRPAASAAVVTPVAPAVAPAAGLRANELTRLKDLLRDLVHETRVQRAELDSLRRLVAAEPAPAPESPPPAAAARADDPVDRTAALRRALGRAVDLAGQPDALRETGDGLRLILPGTLLFGTASSALQIESREVLRRIALVLHRFPEALVSVEGHADARGDPAFNLQLSRQRAGAVADDLREQGIAAERLTVVGLGVTAPIADNETAAGRALNRRVELRFRFRSAGR